MSEISEVITAVAELAWPLIFVILIVFNRKAFREFVDLALKRFRGGAELSIGGVTFGQAVGQLKQPEEGQMIKDDHLALIHRSWRVPEKDDEFGMPMYQIHVIVFGSRAALEKIEKVVYRLEDSYPRPTQNGGSLLTQFELKELAHGYSLVRAEVYIKDQEEPVHLSRFIDLMPESPPLRGTYLFMQK